MPIRLQLAALLAALALAQQGFAQERVFRDGPVNLSDAAPDDEALRQSIQEAMTNSRTSGMNNAAWRDAIENRLVGLGPRALSFLSVATDQYKEYQLDAIQVAIFRIENAPFDPRDAITDWAAAHLANAAADLQIVRVMGGGDAGCLADLFPHHLFYVVVSTAAPKRLLLAVAADAKVQPLNNDADLARFMRLELVPARTEAAMEYAGNAAALLTLSRRINALPLPVAHTKVRAHTAESMLANSQPVRAVVTFDDSGRVAAIATGDPNTSQNSAHPQTSANKITLPAPPG